MSTDSPANSECRRPSIPSRRSASAVAPRFAGSPAGRRPTGHRGSSAAAPASTNGLPDDKDHELVKLLILIGNDAEQRTPDRPSTEDVLRSIAKDVPVGALAKVRESVQHERHKRPRAVDDFAAYAVGALQDERDSREA